MGLASEYPEVTRTTNLVEYIWDSIPSLSMDFIDLLLTKHRYSFNSLKVALNIIP